MGRIETDTIFNDREEAGAVLGKILSKEYQDKNVLVLGIPRGGVVVAYEIAKILNGELAAVITKKLPHPEHEEFAIGAVAEDGSVFLSPTSAGVTFDDIQKIIRDESLEVDSRVQRFRQGRPLPEMQNRIVIIADDGIATGSTVVAAIKLCRARKAAWIVVAAPVSSTEYVSELESLADDVVIFQQPQAFQAVGQVYRDFHQLTDSEVAALLNDYERHVQPAHRL